MMFAAPKLIEAQFIEMLSQSQIALKLQSRVFADRVMRCQECAEPDARHQEFLRRAIYAISPCPSEPDPEGSSGRWLPRPTHLATGRQSSIFQSNRHRRQ
jgi:hypothetical protein